MVEHVKRRSNFQQLSRLLSEIPVSLSHLCLTLDEPKSFIEKLRLVLNCEVESI